MSNNYPTDLTNKSKEILFLSLVGGASVIAGFSSSISAIKKKNPDSFNSATGPMESGERLALRALGRASLLTCFGFSCFCYLGWKVANVSTGEELRTKLRKYIPEAKPSLSASSSSMQEGKINTFSQLIDYILNNSDSKPSE